MIGEFIAEIVGQVVGEILIRGPGYFVLRRFKRTEYSDPDGFWVFAAGLVFWAVIAGIGYGIYRYSF